MTDWKKIRAILFAAAGGYLLYTSWSLFKERASSTSMPLWLTYLFCALFVIAGIVILFYAYKQWQKAKAEEAELEKVLAAEAEAKKQAGEAPELSDPEKDKGRD